MNKQEEIPVPSTLQVILTALLVTTIGALVVGLVFLVLGIFFLGLPAGIFWFGFVAGFICVGIYIYTYIRSGGSV